MITAEQLREHLDYDPDTGVFVRRIAGGKRCPVGSIAGSVKPRGHIVIRINYAMYKAHRLAWLYMHGEWPPNQIDHIDGNPSNNKLSNLRLATNSENHCNKFMPNNTSGYKGVRLDKRRNRWLAEIKKNGKVHWLGYFDTAEMAALAYANAAKIYHGEFARLQ